MLATQQCYKTLKVVKKKYLVFSYLIKNNIITHNSNYKGFTMKKVLSLAVVLGLGSFVFAASDPAAIVAKQCKTCHGAKMEKSYLNKTAIVNTLSSDVIKEDLKGYKAGTLNRHKMGATMKAQVAKLSEEDIEALAKYIPTLK